MSSLKFHWFLPTNGGDSRNVVGGGHGVAAEAAGRPASVQYLGQIARSAEQLGFEAALTPTGAWCEDAWVSTAMISSLSERLKFLVAFRPGMTAPFLAAQMAGTFQNLSGGRLLLNVVTGGEDAEQRMFGDFLDKKQRYARADEFLEIVRRLWTGDVVNFDGEYYHTQGAYMYDIPEQPIPVYVAAGGPVVARYAGRSGDGFICTSGKGPELYTEKLIPAVKEGAEKVGREYDEIDRMIEIKISYDPDPELALENTRFWAPRAIVATRKSLHAFVKYVIRARQRRLTAYGGWLLYHIESRTLFRPRPGAQAP